MSLIDPEVGPRNIPDVQKVGSVYFICDEDGPIEHPECDSGPFSVQADAEWELTQFEHYLEDNYV